VSPARHRTAAALVAAILVVTSTPAFAAPAVDPAAPAASEPSPESEAAPSAGSESDTTTPEDDVEAEDTAPEDAAPEDAAPENTEKPSTEPEPAEPETEAMPQLQGTRVRLLGGQPGELELFRVDPEAGDDAVGTIAGLPYTRVCSDPCPERVHLEEGDELFVAGPRIMPSKTFTLDEDPYELVMQVRSGPKSIRFAGFGLTVSGAILIPGGGLLVGAFEGRGPDIAGFTLIGVGVAALAAGIGLLIRGRTLVKHHARR
jgi:hypothetical protein